MPFQAIKQALDAAGEDGPRPSWGEVMGELWPVISSPLSSGGERLLLDIIRHHGRLRLARTEELPHRMSPEEMIKSLAVQALARWTRLTHQIELKRLELTAASPALQGVIRAVIQTALAGRQQDADDDAITGEEPDIDESDEELTWSVPTHPIPKTPPATAKRRFVARPVGRFGTLTIVREERPRRNRRKEAYELIGQ